MSLLVDPPAGPPIRLPAGERPVAAPERRRQVVEQPVSDGPPDRRRLLRWAPERIGVAVLLVGTGALYLWGLGASGWANVYYSAAAQAGSQSWTALLFGASDAAGSITIDKPPAAIWVMGLAVRLFGLNSWSILVPQALMGVGAVAALYGAVRRWASPAAGVLAGAALALTPVAALMFRFNNPDALLVLLMTLAAYAAARAVDGAATRWMAVAGVCIGLAFLAKQLQALLVVPALAVTFIVASPLALRRRLTALLVGGGAMVLAAGWWIALVELWPAGSRPYIGGSQTNSILELTFGYNGFGRITGDEVGSVGGGGGWGATGLSRLVGDIGGGQVAWLLPAALVLAVATLWITRRAARTDRARAGILLWGGWLLVTAVVFMWMRGIYHDYYLVAVAPAIGGLVGIGGHALWTHRRHRWANVVMAGTIAVTAWWSSALLGRAGDWHPWVADLVLVLGLASAGAVLLGAGVHRVLLPAGVAVGAAVALAGPAAFSIATAATPQSGAIVTAGPATAAGPGGGQGGPGGAPGGGQLGAPPAGPRGGRPQGGRFGANQQGGNQQGGPPVGGRTGGAMGGLLGATEPSTEVLDALLEDADEYEWVAATVAANNAAGYQLALERSVMPIGGFNGSDPAPTRAEFQALVAAGRIHWFIAGGVGGGPGGQQGGSDEAQEIGEWVEANFGSVIVDGVELYDLTVEV